MIVAWESSGKHAPYLFKNSRAHKFLNGYYQFGQSDLVWHSTKHGLDWTIGLDWTVGLDWSGVFFVTFFGHFYYIYLRE